MSELRDLRARIAVIEAGLAKLKSQKLEQQTLGQDTLTITAEIDQVRRQLDALHYERRRLERGL